MTPELSVVVPVYDEEDNLRPLWTELQPVLDGLGLAWEVVFVDDGSRDGSPEVLRALQASDARIRVVRLAANAGETAATEAGLKASRGRRVVTMDADLQNDPRDIPRLLAPLDEWDAVTGWRVDRGAGDGLVRRLSSRLANRVRDAVLGETVQDAGCTFRAFRRDCLRGLPLYRGFHRFIPTLLRMRGYRVLEIPVHHRPRHAGRSKYGIGNRVFVALADLLVVRWMQARTLRYEAAEERGPAGGERGSP